MNLGVGGVSHVSASSSSSHPLLVPGVTRGLLLVEDGMKGWQRRRRIGRLCVPPPPPTERLLVCPPPPSKERERDGRRGTNGVGEEEDTAPPSLSFLSRYLYS